MRYLWVDRLIEAPIASVDGGTLVGFGVPWFAPAYRSVCVKALMRIGRIAGELRI